MRLLTLVLVLCAATPAAAQITGEPVSPYPDPAKFRRGLYSEAEVGAALFLGDARAPLGPGPAFGVRLGYDLLRWAAVQVHGFGSTHATSFRGRPQSGQLLQLYQVAGELKVTARWSQWAVLAFGGAGMGRLSTNLLGTTGLTDADVRATFLVIGGAGVDYHTMSRHFSFGFTPTFVRLTRVRAPGAILATAHVRYTF